MSPSVAAENEYSGSPAVRAIERAAPGFIPALGARSGAGLSALQARTTAASRELPTNSGDPVAVRGSNGVVIKLGLPFNEKAVDGEQQSDGTVVFDNQNGTSSVLVPKEGNSVAAVTVLADPSSPSRFDYDLSVPKGGTATLNDRGAVEMFDANGTFAGVIAPAWAKDATGKAVPTHYELKGLSLTQVVDHRSQPYAYPVVADPWLGVDLIDRFYWYGNDIKVHVTPMMGAVNESIAAGPGWMNLRPRPGAGSTSRRTGSNGSATRMGNS